MRPANHLRYCSVQQFLFLKFLTFANSSVPNWMRHWCFHSHQGWCLGHCLYNQFRWVLKQAHLWVWWKSLWDRYVLFKLFNDEFFFNFTFLCRILAKHCLACSKNVGWPGWNDLPVWCPISKRMTVASWKIMSEKVYE